MPQYNYVNEAVIKHFTEKTGRKIVSVDQDTLSEFSATTLVRDKLLTNYAIEYHPMGYVADQAAPRIQVPEKHGLIYNGSVNAMKRHRTNSAQGLGKPNQISRERQADGSYTLMPYALMTPVTKGEIEAAKRNGGPGIGPMEDAVQFLKDVMAVDREYRVLVELVNTSTFTNHSDMSTGTTIYQYWDDQTDGAPIEVIKRAKKLIPFECGQRATHMLWPSHIRDAFYTHTKVKSWRNESQDYVSGLTDQKVGMVMGLKSIDADAMAIAEQELATAGHTADFNYIIGNNAAVLSIPNSPSRHAPYAMATMAMGKPNVKYVRDEFIDGGDGGYWIILTEAKMQEKVIDVGCAHVITNVLEHPTT
ncbi:MAG: hypothetical protein U9Q07_00430 [Planctomycetota bacterium]|nr:hypothetical protein [Planctomycetota bacterium]